MYEQYKHCMYYHEEMLVIVIMILRCVVHNNYANHINLSIVVIMILITVVNSTSYDYMINDSARPVSLWMLLLAIRAIARIIMKDMLILVVLIIRCAVHNSYDNHKNSSRILMIVVNSTYHYGYEMINDSARPIPLCMLLLAIHVLRLLS